ncbi:MAG: glycosyl hydrolase [Bacteroidota bacterium]
MRSLSASLLALAVVLASSALSGCASGSSARAGDATTWTPTLTDQTSGTDALLIGSHAIDENVVWLSGTGGTVVRTTDGGATWTASVIPGTDTLQLRDIHAHDAQTAWALSIGSGASSRIFKTTDGGASWRTTFVNDEPDGFLDCFSFWDARHGLAFSDSIEDGLYLLTTSDGGETWQRIPPSALPDPLPGEGSFAASGTCVTTRGRSLGWAGMGNASPARVLRTDDRGASWTVASVPVVAGDAAGLASVAFRTNEVGVALGGDIARPDSLADTVARTTDGGRSWTQGGRLPFNGAAYGSAYVPGTRSVVAVGPGGVALSQDDGATWTLVDEQTFWGVTAVSTDAIWLVGPEGRIAMMRLTTDEG